MIETFDKLKKIKFHDLKSLEGCYEILESNENIKSVQFYHCFFKKDEMKHFISKILGKESNFIFEEKPLGMSLLFDNFDEGKHFDLYDNLKFKKMKQGKLEHLFKNFQFHSVHIQSDLIHDFIELFESFPLEKISLSFNNFDEVFGIRLLQNIKKFKNLKNLSISDNFITNKSVANLCNYDQLDSKLAKLILNNTYVTYNGLKDLFNYLSNSNCNLEHLDISKNDLKHESSDILASFFKIKSKVKILNLMDCTLDLNERFFESLSKNTNVTDLNISLNGKLNEESFNSCLELNNTLKKIHLSYLDFDFLKLNKFSKNRTLEYIDLSHCHLNNESIKRIEEIFTQREHNKLIYPKINLSDNYITSEFIESFKYKKLDSYLIFNKVIQKFEPCEDVSKCGIFTDFN